MSWKKPTAGIILAAGESIRFGQTKQLLKIKNKCLIDWVLDAALNSHLEKIVLVLGHQHQKILHALGKIAQHPRLQVVVNPNYKQGQSLSLRVGFEKIRDEFQSVMFLLADQPLVDKKTINDLLDKFWDSDKDICAPTHRGKRGNPTILSKIFYDQLSQIKGDMGARKIIQSHPDLVLQIEIDNPLFFLDIDTPADFHKLNSLIC
ncbi:MAG: nucleotidyltransferase family protein [Desulfobacterales bacterium]|nr:MAG: nucleotidyltransferase family protein [Desulfobacterales bacterium]